MTRLVHVALTLHVPSDTHAPSAETVSYAMALQGQPTIEGCVEAWEDDGQHTWIEDEATEESAFDDLEVWLSDVRRRQGSIAA